MKHIVQHRLSKPAAKRLVARMLEEYHGQYAEYALGSRWARDEVVAIDCRIAALPVRGTVEVCADSFDIEIQLPLPFWPFTQRIRSDLDRQFGRFLAQASSPSAVALSANKRKAMIRKTKKTKKTKKRDR